MQSICIAVQASPDTRYMMARLMPTWHDSVEEQQQQYPVLSAVSVHQAEAMQQHRPVTEEHSFYQWVRSLNLNPTGAAENLMTAMQQLSVSNLVPHQAHTASTFAASAASEEV